ncbi:hypothetical protein H0E87_007649, partial [Populus deltoides]
MLRIDGLWREFCLAMAQLFLSTQNQALFPCFVSAMLSSVTTELAVAALGSLGCISAGSIAGCLGFSAGLFVCVKSGLAQLPYRKSCSLAAAQLLMSMQNHC